MSNISCRLRVACGYLLNFILYELLLIFLSSPEKLLMLALN